MTKAGWVRYKNKNKKRTEDADGHPLLDCEWGGYYVGRVDSRRRRHTTGSDNQRTTTAGGNRGQNTPYSNHPLAGFAPSFTQPWPGTGNHVPYTSQVPAHNSKNSNLSMHSSNPPPPYRTNTNAAGSNILMSGPSSLRNPNKNSKDSSSWAAAQQQQQQQPTASSRDKTSSSKPMSNIPSGLSHIPQKESDRANPAGSEVANNHRTYVVGMVGPNTKKMIDKEKKDRKT